MAKRRPRDDKSEQTQFIPFRSNVLFDDQGRMVPTVDETSERLKDPVIRTGSSEPILCDTEIRLMLGEGKSFQTEPLKGTYSPMVCSIVNRLLAKNNDLADIMYQFLSQLSPATAFLVRVPVGPVPPDEAQLALYMEPALDHLWFVDCSFIAENAAQHERWYFCPYSRSEGIVELGIVPWHSRHVDELKTRCEKAKRAISTKDAERSELLEDTIGPLVNEVELQLRSSSLPEIDAQELRELKQQLQQSGYYADIIDTDEAARILDIDASRVRRLAKQGLLGTSFARTYVFHRADVERFAKLERPSGNPAKHRKNTN